MLTRRKGFTLVEMLFVVIIGAALLAMGTRQYSQISNRRAMGNAANAMLLTVNRARSEAMRSGELVYLRVRPDSGVVLVKNPSGDLVHSLDMDAYGGKIVGAPMQVCYAARGYALPGCTTITGARHFGFVRGVDTAAVQVLPLGQARRVR